MSDNYFASVGAIVIKNNQVLLVRHTYGSAKGKLLFDAISKKDVIPGIVVTLILSFKIFKR